jgi:DNA-binding NarL/FixJ family response regulator
MTHSIRPALRPIGKPRDLESVLKSDETQLEATRLSDGFSMNDSKISVIVVANELLFRHGLARLLNEDDRLDVIAVSDGEPELLELCKATSVDVVVMDIQLSSTDSIHLVRSIASVCSNTQMLILTSTTDWRVRSAVIAGAAGILLKNTSPQAIRAAVVSVHLGYQVLCNEAVQCVLGETPGTRLTQRESDVLRMVAQGASNAEIAGELRLGEKTVRNYVSRLYRKLSLSNRAQFTTYAVHAEIEGGLTRLS